MTADTESTPLTPKDGKTATFSGVLGTVLSCLGCAVGTGNIWRFPRIVAASSGQNGGLVFLLVWVMFLFLWSIPVLLIEYSAGRYTRKGVVQTFLHFLGPKAIWCSLWIGLVNLFIASYYLVIVGWCLYYTFYFIVHSLPENHAESEAIFNSFAQESYWPLLLLAITVLLTALAISKGVQTLEWTNLILTPILLLIIVLVFIWSLTRPHALEGLKFMFSPDWGSFLDTHVWLNAASQNAFDTSAGTGQFIAYAAYMSRDHSIVKYSIGVPMGNNLVSLICGMTTFATSFSSLREGDANISNQEVLGLIQTSGPGGTGIAFMWMPVLLSGAGSMGRIVAVFIFLSMMFAGLTSSIAQTETVVRPLSDFNVPRKYVVPVVCCLQFAIGSGSALDLTILSWQDHTWGYGLLISGLMMQAMVIYYGANKYRKEIINAFGPTDLKAYKIWSYIIKFVAPIETSVVFIWWIVGDIIKDPEPDAGRWYSFTYDSLITVLLEYIVVIGITMLFNFVVLSWSVSKALITVVETEMKMALTAVTDTLPGNDSEKSDEPAPAAPASAE